MLFSARANLGKPRNQANFELQLLYSSEQCVRQGWGHVPQKQPPPFSPSLFMVVTSPEVTCGFLFNEGPRAVYWHVIYWHYQDCFTSALERKLETHWSPWLMKLSVVLGCCFTGIHITLLFPNYICFLSHGGGLDILLAIFQCYAARLKHMLK